MHTTEPEQHDQDAIRVILERALTSTIFDLRNGFLMYHVEVSQVRAQVKSSTFPVNSMLSGTTLCTKLLQNDDDDADTLAYRMMNKWYSTISSMMYSGRTLKDSGTSFGKGSLLK